MTTSDSELVPLMWINENAKDNLVVLTKEAIFVAIVAKAGLDEVDAAITAGAPPSQALKGKYQEIPLGRLKRFSWKRSRWYITRNLELAYEEGGSEHRKSVAFAQPDQRDVFIAKLLGQLGPWPQNLRPLSPVVTLLRYSAIVLFDVVATTYLIYAELTGSIQRAPVCLIVLLSFFGVWGIVILGVVFLVAVTYATVLELKFPSITISYQRQNSARN